MNNMNTARLVAAAAAVIMSLAAVPDAGAQSIDPEILFESAASRDLLLRSLAIEQQSAELSTRLEDHKNGPGLSAGLENEGTAVTGMGKADKPGLAVRPFVEISLSEDSGTSLRASAPVTYSIDENKTETSAGLSLNQNISELLNFQKQDTAKDIRRENSARELELRIEARKNELEGKVLNMLRSMLDLEKSMITNTTSLDEKDRQLNNLLRAGMIARNSSSHLAKLMEIRNLESETEELRLEYTAKAEDFYRLTGFRLDESPRLPETGFPDIPETVQKTAESAERTLLLEQAVLDDLLAPLSPAIDLTVGGTGKIGQEVQPELNANLSTGFEDFTFSLGGSWNKEDGGTISAGLSLNLNDKTKKRLQEQLQEQTVESALIARENARILAEETNREINSEIRKLENRQRNHEINSAFIDKYLEEMEAKFEKGLVPEAELLRARDQKKGIELDGAILNIDRYLILNRISNLYE